VARASSLAPEVASIHLLNMVERTVQGLGFLWRPKNAG